MAFNKSSKWTLEDVAPEGNLTWGQYKKLCDFNTLFGLPVFLSRDIPKDAIFCAPISKSLSLDTDAEKALIINPNTVKRVMTETEKYGEILDAVMLHDDKIDILQYSLLYNFAPLSEKNIEDEWATEETENAVI